MLVTSGLDPMVHETVFQFDQVCDLKSCPLDGGRADYAFLSERDGQQPLKCIKYHFAKFSYASIEVFSEDHWLGEAWCWRVEVVEALFLRVVVFPKRLVFKILTDMRDCAN